MRTPRSIIPTAALTCFLIVGCASDNGAEIQVANPTPQIEPDVHAFLEDTNVSGVVELDNESRQAALNAAQQTMTAFARPQLDPQTWWADLAPYLTQRARQDYAYVQPSAVTATNVTATAHITDEPSSLLVHVAVPTDVGEYMLIVARIDGASPWEVARITPPEGVH